MRKVLSFALMAWFAVARVGEAAVAGGARGGGPAAGARAGAPAAGAGGRGAAAAPAGPRGAAGGAGAGAAPAAAAPAEVAGEPRPMRYGRTREADLISVKLELEIDFPEERWWGKSTTHLAAFNDGLERVELDAIDLEIKSIKAEGGADLKFDYDGKALGVNFATPLKAGEELSFTIDYAGRKPARGLYFMHPNKDDPDRLEQVWSQGEQEDNRYWFPVFDYPNERIMSEMSVTVASPKVVLSNGELAGIEELEGGKRRFRWVQADPIAPYLVTLVAGEFAIVEGGDVNGVKVNYYVAPRHKDMAEPTFGKTPAMIKAFNEIIGTPYAWAKYSQVIVQDFTAGGMENVSATTMNERILVDAKNRVDADQDSIVAHELAHQWFGDLLTCRDWSHIWLNEGFATYFEKLWIERDEGPEEFEYNLYTSMRSTMAQDSRPGARPIVRRDYDNPSEMFGYTAYAKPGAVLHMLRRELGDPLWTKALHHYVETNKQRPVETTDFLRAVEEATGRNMEGFFDQWFYRGGSPRLRATYRWDDKLKLAVVTLEQTQPVNAANPAFRLRVPVSFFNADGKEAKTEFEMTEARQTFYAPLYTRPVAVSVDPRSDLLTTLEFRRSREEWLQQLKVDPTVTGRARALAGLGEFNDARVAEEMGAVLNSDTFWGVRVEAANALGAMGGDAAKALLLASAEKTEGDPRVRAAALTQLEKFKGDDAMMALRKAIGDETATARTRAAAVSALSGQDKDAALTELAKALKIESLRNRVRDAALTGLNRLEAWDRMDEVRALADAGSPADAREAALPLLGEMAAGSKDKDKIEETRGFLLGVAERGESARLRRAAIRGLGALGDAKAIPVLERLSDQAAERAMKSSADAAITRIRGAQTAAGPRTGELESTVADLRRERDALEERVEALEKKLERLATLIPGGAAAATPAAASSVGTSSGDGATSGTARGAAGSVEDVGSEDGGDTAVGARGRGGRGARGAGARRGQ